MSHLIFQKQTFFSCPQIERSGKIWNILFSPVCCMFIYMSVCPFVNFNFAMTFEHDGSKFHIFIWHTYSNNEPVEMKSRLMTLWPSPWPLFLKYLFWLVAARGTLPNNHFLFCCLFYFWISCVYNLIIIELSRSTFICCTFRASDVDRLIMARCILYIMPNDLDDFIRSRHTTTNGSDLPRSKT